MPDFELGIIEGNGEKSVWQSQSGSEEPSPHPENRMDTPDQLEERVGRDTEMQLKHLLNLSEGYAGVSKSHDRGRKRSRYSNRRSRTVSRSREKGVKRNDYTCPSKIAKIFGKDIPAKTLCALSALKDETPAAILDLVPAATTEQICKMCKLLEGPDPAESVRATGSKKKRRRRSR